MENTCKNFRILPETLELFEQFKADNGIKKDNEALDRIVRIAVKEYAKKVKQCNELFDKAEKYKARYNEAMKCLIEKQSTEHHIDIMINRYRYENNENTKILPNM